MCSLALRPLPGGTAHSWAQTQFCSWLPQCSPGHRPQGHRWQALLPAGHQPRAPAIEDGTLDPVCQTASHGPTWAATVSMVFRGKGLGATSLGTVWACLPLVPPQHCSTGHSPRDPVSCLSCEGYLYHISFVSFKNFFVIIVKLYIKKHFSFVSFKHLLTFA